MADVSTTPQKPAAQSTSEGDEVDLRLEAVLVTSDRPHPASRLCEILDLTVADGGSKVVEDAIDRLNEVYDATGRSFRIERVAGGFRMMTRPDFGETIQAASRQRNSSKLSQAAIETLAIVAYRQPITRADVEVIRGVSCGEVLRTLLDRHLVKTVGRAEEVGRPMLYGTTKAFLESFGLATLGDLPNSGDFKGG